MTKEQIKQIQKKRRNRTIKEIAEDVYLKNKEREYLNKVKVSRLWK
jgi:hypothetical protein